MPDVLNEEDFQKLKQSLPYTFYSSFKNEKPVLIQAFPLLNLICKNRDAVKQLKNVLQLPDPPLGPELGKHLQAVCTELERAFVQDPVFVYRLPIVLSEFPVHSRPINKSVQAFNLLIEAYHTQDTSGYVEEIKNPNNFNDVTERFKEILKALKTHGPHCDEESLWQLLEMMSGWTEFYLNPLFNNESKNVAPIEVVVDTPKKEDPIRIIELEQPTEQQSLNPFIQDYHFNFNGAGRLANETDFLLLNAFGMKIGGHFDAQVKYPPRYIPLEELHAIIQRQLSHRMDLSRTEAFQFWIEASLNALGVQYIQRTESFLAKDILVNPFLSEPISCLSPEKIQAILREKLPNFTSDQFNPSTTELDILGQYLFELVQGFQVNPGQALGIGANWDGTINLSNEAGTYAFKFRESEAAWGKRFKQISLHRQGPSEAKMNAAIGIKFEFQSLLSSFEYMSQLQPSEYKDVLYNALIDNIVTDLFPEPAYFENQSYQKYRKHYVVKKDHGLTSIDSFYAPSKQGTYFSRSFENPKQTPMYRRAGTLDVLAFPRNTTYSEQSRVCYEGNPLGPLQLQYAQAMMRSTRGHLAYNPIGPDSFIEDAFYGQVIRSENGDYLPFIGVIPKNFNFKQKKELCASFVVRMLLSSRLKVHCPTFSQTCEHIKSQFLPSKELQVPDLPQFCSLYLVNKRQDLINKLTQEDRNFTQCEHGFYSIFKNLIYSLYEYGHEDEYFKHSFLYYVHSNETFQPMSKAKCDKIIRDVSVNRPVNGSPEALHRYDEVIQYLRKITTYFYPTPSDSVVETIAKTAKNYAHALLESDSIRSYFNQIRNNNQTNLSRKQSPGMIFASLLDGRPLKNIDELYTRMHKENFASFYRDPDGTPNGEPQIHDTLLDWGAKKIGALTQMLHKYNLFAVFHYPLSEPYLNAKQRRAEHKNHKTLWTIAGGVEGFFWNGLLKGLWQTSTTPAHMIYDFLRWNYHLIQNKNIQSESNPLNLPSAPANIPSAKALFAAQSRDLVLKLLGVRAQNSLKKNAVIQAIIQQAQCLYPQIQTMDCSSYYTHLEQNFPLTAREWSLLFEPLVSPNINNQLARQMHEYNPYINKNFLQAVFRCVTHPEFTHQRKDLVKESYSFYGLSSKQIVVLKKTLALYEQTKRSTKHAFLELFQFNGTIHRALLVRDQLLQKTQNFMLTVFQEDFFHFFSKENNTRIPFVNKTQTNSSASLLSTKDKAQRKWANFAQRELRHQLLNPEEAKELMLIISKKLLKITAATPLLTQLEGMNGQQTLSGVSLELFYECIHQIENLIQQALEINKEVNVDYVQAKDLLNNFRNISMNAIINSKLDNINIFSSSFAPNPLLNSTAIAHWLETLKHTNDLRSLLEQQVQQAPSIDHALWRCKCILQIMEQPKPQEKIAKTGMQNLLRFWCQHKDNVTVTGERYINPTTGEPEKSAHDQLINDSFTMRHAITQVQSKLSQFSFLRAQPQRSNEVKTAQSRNPLPLS
jgi:hypothetical protein